MSRNNSWAPSNVYSRYLSSSAHLGASTATGGFGSNTGFGAKPATTGFGAQPTTGFGATANTGFGGGIDSQRMAENAPGLG
jgi:nuclear pore complex protein Nup98-Nup96